MDNGASSYRRFLEGDNAGMAELIREYKDGLALYLCSITRNICEAEELMEETFVRLAVNKPEYTGKSSFKTWLYTIGRHLAIDYVRRRKWIADIPVHECYKLTDEQDLEAIYIREEQKVELRSAMRKLKPDYQQVLWLIYFEEFSNAEAAVIMHKSKRQIENLLYRAKVKLKNELEKGGFRYEGL